MQFDITHEELRSFAMGFYRFSLVEGPMRFVRFSDSARGEEGKFGRFWMHASDVEALLARLATGRELIDRVSDGWAICDDWGDKACMWVMTLPAKVRIPAAIGKAHFQPTISKDTQRKQKDLAKWNASDEPVYWLVTDRSYAGGGLQYVIPVRATDRQINKDIAALIGPQLATAMVATNPGLFLSGW
ncbi:hypothetical protein [Methylorubrum extorquens]|uniref:Uncharacterized protein n=1 Tax=Methylorubrum extorquens TaxID=408 RepID=A0AAX3WDM6_METEX|nr:hypothetical protein [Methylorubrum extorquens]WHQ68591.1 hypothetical protein KEC54_19735 [Methylorubrum extorquens]